ncbi:LacI family DNA-binding transcriptional regulator [Vibrio sp. WXL103]|uniref:LacI family DNA-binding transcriptional regulator n=1 Tax=Vibrio sp. WXL103 TaxID=3450710 RepID=UPI003EC52AED
MNNKKLKLADIAELAGVSKSTVSLVLNGHAKKHRITEDTVKKVEQVARKYNYSPSVYARALKSKQTFTAGLVIPDLANMGFAAIAKQLELLCRGSGYQLLIASSEDNPALEQQVVENLLERQVDIIMVASSMRDEQFYRQVKQRLPVILFDRVMESNELLTIKTDTLEATSNIVANLAKGMDECVYFGGQLELSPSRERLAGYKQGLERAGLRYDHNKVFHRDYQADAGYQMMYHFVEQYGREPKALFTASYTLLEGVLRYLAEQDLLNSTIRLATFDNYPILDCLPLKVDAIEQDCQLIAQNLFDQASCLLSDPTQASKAIVLPAKLHRRR